MELNKKKFMILSVSVLHSVEWQTDSKDGLEKCVHDTTEVLSWYFPRRTEENHDKQPVCCSRFKLRVPQTEGLHRISAGSQSLTDHQLC
jgi:hypothetical protein